MDLATQNLLKSLRDMLNYRLVELRADVHAAQRARSESGGAGAHEVADRKDEGWNSSWSVWRTCRSNATLMSLPRLSPR